MSCTFEEDLTAYLDHALPADRRAAVDAHLSTCRECAGTLKLLRLMVVELEPQPSTAVSSDFDRGLQRRLNALPPSAPRGWSLSWRLFLPPLAVALGALALVVLRPEPAGAPLAEPEALAIAEHWRLMENYDLLGVDAPDDLEVIAALHELEVTP